MSTAAAALAELDLPAASGAEALEGAIQVDVHALSDGERVVVAGVAEYTERVGAVSSGAVCVIPPYSLGGDQVAAVRRMTRTLAVTLGVVGLVNVHFAVRDDVAYVVEVAPGASPAVPFVSAAIGAPLTAIVERVARGESLAAWPDLAAREPTHVAVRTARAIGIGVDFLRAYLKALLAGDAVVPMEGRAFVGVRNRDVRAAMVLAARLVRIGFVVVTPPATARLFARQGLAVEVADDPAGVALVIDTREGRAGCRVTPAGVACYTSLDGADAIVAAIEALRC